MYFSDRERVQFLANLPIANSVRIVLKLLPAGFHTLLGFWRLNPAVRKLNAKSTNVHKYNWSNCQPKVLKTSQNFRMNRFEPLSQHVSERAIGASDPSWEEIMSWASCANVSIKLFCQVKTGNLNILSALAISGVNTSPKVMSELCSKHLERSKLKLRSSFLPSLHFCSNCEIERRT